MAKDALDELLDELDNYEKEFKELEKRREMVSSDYERTEIDTQMKKMDDALFRALIYVERAVSVGRRKNDKKIEGLLDVTRLDRT